MADQERALRLADALDRGGYDTQMARNMEKAADQLRRLHAVNAELLEALKSAAEYLHDKSGCLWLRSDFQRGCRCSEDCSSIAVWKQARATIAKAEGEAK
jgi:hypothetical protein